MDKIKQNRTYNLPDLIGKLRNEDARYSRLTRNFQWVYWILIPIYAIMVTLELFEEGKINTLISGICYILSMLIFAMFFRKYYKEYRDVNYDLPTLEMLKQAKHRYTPFKKDLLWILLAILLMDAGLSLGSIWEMEGIKAVLVFQLLYMGTMLGSAGIGLVVWYFKYKPLYDGAKKLIKEIES